MVDGSTFSFAGLGESWTSPSGDAVESCTILTTNPNVLFAGVHGRMPVILKTEEYARWLDPRINNPALVLGSLKPFDADLMKKYPGSTRVNHPENDDYECAQEISVAVTPTLF
jgi:putative SOS response-associated peptidase YedK